MQVGCRDSAPFGGLGGRAPGSSRDYDILNLEDGCRFKQNLAWMDLQNLNIPSAQFFKRRWGAGAEPSVGGPGGGALGRSRDLTTEKLEDEAMSSLKQDNI